LIALPAGVESLTAIDPQNALLVRGTPEGIETIREIINYLDRPIAQVEIEAQFISVRSDRQNEFRLGFLGRDGSNSVGGGTASPFPILDVPANGGIDVNIVRGDFRVQIQAAINRGLGRLVSSPRVTTFNNLTAQIRQVTPLPVVFTSSTITPGTGGSPPILTTTQELEFFSTGTILTVTPTINQDGTITIAMQPLVLGQIGGVEFGGTGDAAGIVPVITAQQIDTLTNVKDGETLAIGGLRSKNIQRSRGRIPLLGSLPLIGSLFRSKVEREIDEDLIIFVTARIVRRINDPVAGT
jgi:general secretion pathway protein D